MAVTAVRVLITLAAWAVRLQHAPSIMEVERRME